MKRIQQLFLITVILISFKPLFAQENEADYFSHTKCGLEEASEEFFQKYPELKPLVEQERKQLEQETQTFIESKGTEDDILIIPVVFHIVHEGGSENISDEQVRSAIDALNEDFSASNSDIGDVIEEFAGIVANVGFEFRLAKIDPDGNCTNGINRIFSPTTNDGDTDMKLEAGIWDRSSYLNIWTCRQIGESGSGGTILGYATFPSSFTQSVDGIVMRSEHVGDMGTSNTSRKHTLSHEVGHWANLFHTWGSGQSGSSSNCGDDDAVSDTPTTIGSPSFCDLNNVTCGSLDNVQNFMDYTFCFRMFTEGQSNRMRAAMNSSVGSRSQLYSPSNLAETGVLEPDEICFAEFQMDKASKICLGQEIEFEDISYNGIENWEWTFEGGTPATSTDNNPVIIYETPGVYSVSLTVSNASGEQTIVKEDLITVLGEAEYALPFEESFENISEIGENDEWVSVNPDGSAIRWELTDQAAFTGNQSVYVRGRNNEDSQIETLESPTFDLSGLEENAVVSFKYAHARRNSFSDDLFQVRISRNCGENWNLRETRDIDELPTVSGNFGGQFIPDSDDDWEEVIIDNISPSFLTSEFRVRFEFTSVRGNNIFIDDLNIYDPNTLSVDNSNVVKEITLFPNPASESVRIRVDLTENQNISINVMDASGRIVQSPFSGFMSSGSQSMQIQLDGSLTPGLYFVRLSGEEGVAVRKLMVE